MLCSLQWIMENDEETKRMFEEFIFGLLKAASRGSRKGVPFVEELPHRGEFYREQIPCC